MKIHLKISEFELSQPIALSEVQLSALTLFNTEIGILGTHRTGEYRIQATSWVGNILLPGIVLSIEPKIGPSDLIRLLLMGDGEAIPRWVQSILMSKQTLWDLIADLLNTEVKRLVQHGLAKNYLEFEGNLIAPAGQIFFYQDFIENFPVRNGIYCRYHEFSEDLPKNRALKWALEVLGCLVTSNKHQELMQTTELLTSVSLTLDPPIFEIPGKDDPYRFPLFLVELLKRFSSVASGRFGFKGNGYLMNMNDIFEGFVRNQLRQKIKIHGINVATKGNIKRTLCEGVRLEPDIVICGKNQEAIAVADCKYKRDWNKINSDVYQMLAYLEGYRPVTIAIVFYPTSATKIIVDTTAIPRERILYSVGLPENKLLDEGIWFEIRDLIALILSKPFDSKRAIA